MEQSGKEFSIYFMLDIGAVLFQVLLHFGMWGRDHMITL